MPFRFFDNKSSPGAQTKRTNITILVFPFFYSFPPRPSTAFKSVASDSSVAAVSVMFGVSNRKRRQASTDFDCAAVIADQENIDVMSNYVGEIVSLASESVSATSVQISFTPFCVE